MPLPKSFLERMIEGLQQIESYMIEFIDASSVGQWEKNMGSPVRLVRPDFHWEPSDEVQTRLQIRLKGSYSQWIAQLRLLLHGGPEEILTDVRQTDEFVVDWIEKRMGSEWCLGPDMEKNKAVFRGGLEPFYRLIRSLDDASKRELILVPDTNSMIQSPDPSQYSTLHGEDKYTIVILPTVLAELDKLKVAARDSDFRDKVRSAIKRIKGFRNQGSLLKGITVNRTVTVRTVAKEPDFKETLGWLDEGNNDDRIIASTFELQRVNPSAIVVLVTGDINLQNKAELANLPFYEPPEEK